MDKLINVKLITGIMIILVSFLATELAFAKGFSGGRGFSMSRSHHATNSNHAKSTTNTAKSGASKWGGVLGGLVMGGLLASLFMGHGFASGILTWLILGIVVVMVVNFIRRRINNNTYHSHNNIDR